MLNYLTIFTELSITFYRQHFFTIHSENMTKIKLFYCHTRVWKLLINNFCDFDLYIWENTDMKNKSFTVYRFSNNEVQ